MLTGQGPRSIYLCFPCSAITRAHSSYSAFSHVFWDSDSGPCACRARGSHLLLPLAPVPPASTLASLLYIAMAALSQIAHCFFAGILFLLHPRIQERLVSFETEEKPRTESRVNGMEQRGFVILILITDSLRKSFSEVYFSFFQDTVAFSSSY